MAFDFIIDGQFDVFKGIDVLDFDFCAKCFLTIRTNGDVSIATHGAFFHLAIARERIDDDVADRFNVAHGLGAIADVRTGDDFHELAKKDVAFHDIIYAATENQRLVQMLNNLREQMYRYRLEYLKDESAHRTLAEEHIQITEAIRTRDEEKAVSIMHRHILAQEKAVLSKIHAQEMEEKAKKAAGEAR